MVICLPAFSQSTRFLSTETRSFHALGIPPSAHPCSIDGDASADSSSDEISRTDSALPPCSLSLSRTSVPAPIVPCDVAGQAITPCAASSDVVLDDLKTMGKKGQLILRARERVLAILQSENACTAWYRSKDPDPAATFRTLMFVLDRKGEAFVRMVPESGGMELIRNPYVASVVQDGGPNSVVTVNTNGAFFFPAANVVSDKSEGGPLYLTSARPIQVGPYVGGTFRAQVVVLLHEFGHVINLLPEDHDDREGRSRQNTLNVLRACRAEVESKEAPRTFLASR